MSRKKIVNDKDGKLVEIDQDKIEAALAGAVTMANGAKPPMPPPPPQEERDESQPWYGKENLEKSLVKDDKEQVKESKRGMEEILDAEEMGETPDECGYDPQETGINDSGQIAMSQSQFIEACHNLTINAKQCFYQSSKHPDRSVDEYIRSINKKIFGETQKGGYSTNVQFRVTPQDWINVNHIFDWYKNRGFTVDVKETTSSPYGKDVGTMNYNFTISWSNA